MTGRGMNVGSHVVSQDGATGPVPVLLCPRCESEHLRPGEGHRLPVCLSCGLVFDTYAINYTDAELLAYSPEWAEAEDGDGWSAVYEAFTVLGVPE